MPRTWFSYRRIERCNFETPRHQIYGKSIYEIGTIAKFLGGDKLRGEPYRIESQAIFLEDFESCMT